MLVHHTEERTMINNHTARRRNPRPSPSQVAEAENGQTIEELMRKADEAVARRVPRMLTVQVMVNGTKSPRLAAKMGLAIAAGEVELVGLPAEGRTLRFAGDRLFMFVEYDDAPEEGR